MLREQCGIDCRCPACKERWWDAGRFVMPKCPHEFKVNIINTQKAKVKTDNSY